MLRILEEEKVSLMFKSKQKRLTSLRNLFWASVEKEPTQRNL